MQAKNPVIWFEIYVDDKLIGFSIGEKFNKELCIIHVEKCLK